MFTYKKFKEINEYRNQLEIPFDNKHPLHDKPDHVHLLDALMGMTKKFLNVDDYFSEYTKNDIGVFWEEYKKAAFEIFKHDSLGDNYPECLYKFLELYEPRSYPNYYNEEVNQYIEENPEAGKGDYNDADILREFDLYDELPEHLSEEGEKIFKGDNFISMFFEDRFDQFDVEWNLKKNITDNGLIPIWRAVNYSAGEHLDLYDNTVKNYNGVGIFWSFEEDGAQPHGGGAGATYVLHGFVSPEHINWTDTIYKSAWYLNEEKEIELNEKSDVLIYKVTDQYENEIKFKKAMIIST